MRDAQRPAPLASGLSINKPFFVSPPAAGRQITAGFSWLQRIGKSASFDVWFPEALRQALDEMIAEGKALSDAQFPASWAAVRQFELLQEAGNYKIYDLDSTHLTRTLVDLARNMRAGGYRVTVATIGGYQEGACDELQILDRRLQDRLSHLLHMLYLEEQSQTANDANDADLAAGDWDYRTALPHIGVTLGARDLFRGNKEKKGGGKKSGGGGSGGAKFSAEHRHQLAGIFSTRSRFWPPITSCTTPPSDCSCRN